MSHYSPPFLILGSKGMWTAKPNPHDKITDRFYECCIETGGDSSAGLLFVGKMLMGSESP